MSTDPNSDLVSEDDVLTSDFDLDRIESVASSLELRTPNKEALDSIVFEVVQHYEIDKKKPPFEAVVDSATGVGKTYILAAAIEYFASKEVSDFAVITPGRTILDKTVANFTAGNPKSLLGGMSVKPVVITAENFNTAAMREAMDDPQQVKLYVFTVQSLIKPQTKAGRKTHKFQEGLGQAFYEHLEKLDDLYVFADEHHAYYGNKFSEAVRDLEPRVLIGLTATPHRNTARGADHLPLSAGRRHRRPARQDPRARRPQRRPHRCPDEARRRSRAARAQGGSDPELLRGRGGGTPSSR